jgi:hypothetical protein
MYLAIEMIPAGTKWLERNLRLGGYSRQDAAERAVLKRGTGFVLHYESNKTVAVAIKGKLHIIQEKK